MGSLNRQRTREVYRVDVPARGQGIRIVLTDLGADYDLHLFGPDGVKLGQSIKPGTATEVIDAAVPQPGTFFIHVTVDPGQTSQAGFPYRLTVTLSTWQVIVGDLAPGARIGNSYGLAVDGSGNVYVADKAASRIVKFAPSGDLVATWGGFGTDVGQLQGPDGIAVDDAGNVYVADTGNNRVQKFSAAGEPLAQWGTSGSGVGQFIAPGSVAVDGAGSIYVADTGNHRIQRISVSGAPVAQWGSRGDGPGQFRFPRGVAVDAQGNVWVADSSRIQKLSASGEPLGQWGMEGSGPSTTPGRLRTPRSLAFDGSGGVYVVADSIDNYVQKLLGEEAFVRWGDQLRARALTTDSTGNVYVISGFSGAYEIVKLTPGGQQLSRWGKVSTSPGELNQPRRVAVDNQQNLYVADSFNDRIQKVPSDGGVPSVWTSDPARFEYPRSVAVDMAGKVYVASGPSPESGTRFGRQGIRRLNADGSPAPMSTPFTLRVTDVAVSADGSSMYALLTEEPGVARLSPTGQILDRWGGQLAGAAIEASGSLVVAESSGRLFRFGKNGELVARFGGYGESPGKFIDPAGVALDRQGNLYVADRGNHRIQKLSPRGEPLAQWGARGDSPGQFEFPTGVAVDAAGNLYVADSGNGRIQKLAPTGAPLAQWGSEGPGQLQFPEPIALDAQGNVYVGSGSRIQKFSSSGQPLAQWESSVGRAVGLAVDAQLNTYVLGFADRIMKLSPTGEVLGIWGGGSSANQISLFIWGDAGIAVDPDGVVYAVDNGHDRFLKLSANGTPLTEWQRPAGAGMRVSSASGIAIDVHGNAYVSTGFPSQIIKVSEAGELLATFGGTGIEPGMFLSPRGMTLDRQGNLYVADTGNHRIQKLSPTGEPLGTWGSRGLGVGQFTEPNGVALGADGTLYVADTGNHRIQALRLGSRAAEERGTILFAEDFDSSTTQFLGSTADANYSASYSPSGEYVLKITNPEWDRLPIIAVPGDFSDAAIVLDAYLVGDTSNRYITVTCRTQGNGDHYRLMVEPSSGAVTLYRVAGNTFVSLGSEQVSSAVRLGNARNRIELSCAGETISATINGTPVLSVQDGTYRIGRMWFSAGAFLGVRGTTQANFDNLVVLQR